MGSSVRAHVSSDKAGELYPAIRKSLIYIGVFLVVCVGAFLLMGRTTDGRAFIQSVGSVPWWAVVAALLLALLNDGIRAVRFQYFAKKLGLRVPFKEMIVYYFAGFSMGISPGKLGEVARLWFLKKSHKAPYHKSLVLQVGDRANDVYATLVLCMVGMTHFAPYRQFVFVLIAVFFALSAFLVWPGHLKRLVRVFYGLLRKKPRLFVRVQHLIDNLAFLFKPRIFMTSLVLGVAGWVSECVALYVLLMAMGAPISFLSALFIFAFANLIGGLSMIPGGLGGVELTMFALLRFNDVPPEIATAATAIIRVCTLWFGVGLGFVHLPFALRLCHARRAKA